MNEVSIDQLYFQTVTLKTFLIKSKKQFFPIDNAIMIYSYIFKTKENETSLCKLHCKCFIDSVNSDSSLNNKYRLLGDVLSDTELINHCFLI